MTSKLPAGTKMLPELAERINAMLQPYTGKKLEKAVAAVERLRKSGLAAPWGELLAAYDRAIADAVA